MSQVPTYASASALGEPMSASTPSNSRKRQREECSCQEEKGCELSQRKKMWRKLPSRNTCKFCNSPFGRVYIQDPVTRRWQEYQCETKHGCRATVMCRVLNPVEVGGGEAMMDLMADFIQPENPAEKLMELVIEDLQRFQFHWKNERNAPEYLGYPCNGTFMEALINRGEGRLIITKLRELEKFAMELDGVTMNACRIKRAKRIDTVHDRLKEYTYVQQRCVDLLADMQELISSAKIEAAAANESVLMTMFIEEHFAMQVQYRLLLAEEVETCIATLTKELEQLERKEIPSDFESEEEETDWEGQEYD